jgi:hypothetical protein
MSKLKNYINYIANDLMKVIKIDEDRVSFPWVMEDINNFYNDSFTKFPFWQHTVMEMSPYYHEDVINYPNDMEFFENYVVGRYGVKRGTEVNLVWKVVKDKLYDLAPELRLDPNDM